MSQNIKGLPEWISVVRWGTAKPGEYILVCDTDRHAKVPWRIEMAQDGVAGYWLIVVPNNVYGLVNINEAKIPEGFTRGPFDVPSEDEWWLSQWGSAYQGIPRAEAGDHRRIILIPNKPKRVLVIECEEPEYFGSPVYARMIWHGKEIKILSHRIEERKP